MFSPCGYATANHVQTAERLLLQYMVAVTISHELAVRTTLQVHWVPSDGILACCLRTDEARAKRHRKVPSIYRM